MRLRVLVLGGTRFIGRAIVEELVRRGHAVAVVHRGEHEPPDLPDVEHVHLDRREEGALAAARDRFESFQPDAVLDCLAFGARDSDETLAALPTSPGTRLLVLSSMDTYRAYGALHAGTQTDAVPLDETSPVRADRYPYRGQVAGMDDYEKLDVEERWLARGATVLRLPMTYGPRDGQRREEFVLRRIRAGRTQIPVGAANGLFTHGYVGDVARGVRLALEADPGVVRGEVFNLGERRTPPVGLRARWIVDAAGLSGEVELVRVPDDALPPDLGITGAVAQHLLVDCSKARAVLGWDDSDPHDALRASVEWHLAHPPQADVSADSFAADDEALALAARASA